MSQSRVVVVKTRGAFSTDGELDAKRVQAMLQRGIELLGEHGRWQDTLGAYFRSRDIIGLKINTIGGKAISTRPELTESFARLLTAGGFPADNIVIWDRTNRELREAGYSLRMNRVGLKVYGTDSRGVGYGSRLVAHRNVGSLFSAIQERIITASVSLAILKDHGMAGVTAGMKNYFGAIHNPNKYHDNRCDPFVAEVFETPLIRDKHRLSIIDALRVQYHRGPAYHARWAEPAQTLIFSTDPVAADFTGWRLIEQLRAGAGLPTLEEEARHPDYILTAARMGLGRARSKDIRLIVEEI